ncbi:MAG: hypothetical protein IT343_04845 [Candidatus Melainabacteria bacterium]|jgi:hypothetical protein|nr:hypothetical protein [Candidatus Melainabacteria bacterium]
MDDHIAAVITVIGMTCDVMGGLYLAYDLLGGENGPLARLTKIVNYSVLLVLLFLTTMGLKFSLIVGIAFGTALGLHFDRAGKGIPDTNKFLLATAILRGCAITGAVSLKENYVLGLTMGILVFMMSLILPKMKISPSMLYQSGKKPQVTLKQVVIALALMAIATGSGLLGASIAHGDAKTINFVIRFGLTFGFAIFVVSTVSPLIEWYSDNLPPQTFGTAGVVLFIIGFVIQAIPSVATIFDVAK